MECIALKQMIPDIFALNGVPGSDIWERDILFRKGKCYLVEAASGTGKTSLCSYIYGYRNDYRGKLLFDERDSRTLSVNEWSLLRKQSVSLLFQDLRLFPELTAGENVQLKNNLTCRKSEKELKSLFEKMGIAGKWDILVGRLSFGQQQRVAFIRALCQPFDFIFLDEPVSHLDDSNSKIMSELLFEEAGNSGAGIVVTSVGRHLELNYDNILRL